MRYALASSTLHENAAQHLARLVSFPQATEDSDPVINAKKRVTEAEDTLRKRMVDVQQAFSELLRRSLAKPGVADGDVAHLDLEWVKDRLARLENVGVQVAPESTAPPPPLDDAPAPPPALPHPATLDDTVPDKPQMAGAKPDQDVDMEGAVLETEETVRQGKRRRARELLESVVERLSAVEMRTEDIYSQLYAFEGNQREPGIVSWEELYEKRDPDLRAQREVEQQASTEQTDPGPKAEAVNRPAEEEALRGDGHNKASASAENNDVVEKLRDRVRALEAELAKVKVEQAAGKESVAEAAKESVKEQMATYRAEMEAHVLSTIRQEINRLTAGFRAQQATAKQGQQNGSPSLAISAGPSPQLQNALPAGAGQMSSPSLGQNVQFAAILSPTLRAQTVPPPTSNMPNVQGDMNGGRAASIAAPERTQPAQHQVFPDPRAPVHIDQLSSEPMVMVSGRPVPLRVAQQWAAHMRANGTMPEASMGLTQSPHPQLQAFPPGMSTEQGGPVYHAPQHATVSPVQVFQQAPSQHLIPMPPQQQPPNWGPPH